MADVILRAAPAVATRRTRARAAASRVLVSGGLLAVSVVWLLPAVWVLVTSLKRTQDIVRVPPEWIPWPITFVHYGEVFWSARTASIGRAFVNSTAVAIATVVGLVVVSALAAYPLARMRFPGKNVVFGLFVGSLMVPGIIGLIPLYVLMQRLGWLSSYQALVLPELATPFGVFLLRQFFLSLPSELEDAARIDGANTWQVFWRILMPLSQPALAALSIFAFRIAWNDFTWPLIAMNRQEMFTLPVALSLLRGAYTSESYGPIMAGAVVSALPLLIVFLVANRHIVEGVQLSGLKG
jgi:multiple sugar transport system permease protein